MCLFLSQSQTEALSPDPRSEGLWQLLGIVRAGSDLKVRAFASFAPTEDALLAGALVRGAEADEEASLLIFLLLMQDVVRLPFRRLPPQLGA